MGRENSIFHSLLADQRRAKQKDKKNEVQRGRLQRVKHQAQMNTKTSEMVTYQGLYVVGHQMMGTTSDTMSVDANKKVEPVGIPSQGGSVTLKDDDETPVSRKTKIEEDAEEDFVYRNDDLGGIYTPLNSNILEESTHLQRLTPLLLHLSKSKLKESLNDTVINKKNEESPTSVATLTWSLKLETFDEETINSWATDVLIRYEAYKLLILASIWTIPTESLLYIIREEVTKLCLKLGTATSGKEASLDEGERFIKQLREHQTLLRNCDIETVEDVGSVPDITIGYMWSGMEAIAALGLFTDSKHFPVTRTVDALALRDYGIPSFSFLLALDLYDCLSNIAIHTNNRFKHQPLLYECKALQSRCLSLMSLESPIYVSLYSKARRHLSDTSDSVNWIIKNSHPDSAEPTFAELSHKFNQTMIVRYVLGEVPSFGIPLPVLMSGWGRIVDSLLTKIYDSDGFRSKNDRDATIRETLEKMTQRSVLTISVPQEDYSVLQSLQAGRSTRVQEKNRDGRKERTRFRKFTNVNTSKTAYTPMTTNDVATIICPSKNMIPPQEIFQIDTEEEPIICATIKRPLHEIEDDTTEKITFRKRKKQ